MIGQAVLVIVAVLGYLSTRQKIHQTRGDISDVQQTVNGNLAKSMDRTEQLVASLQKAGVDVPPRRDLPAPSPTGSPSAPDPA